METLEHLKTRLIDKIMLAQNEQLLSGIEAILSSTESEDRLILNSYQIELLMLGEKDIENGNLISDEDLRKEDAKWMD